MMAKGTIWSIESIKNQLVITFEVIVAYSMIGLGLIWLGLMMCYGVIMDNIQQCYDYLFKRKINIQTAIIIDSILSYSKNWSKNINEKVVWL